MGNDGSGCAYSYQEANHSRKFQSNTIDSGKYKGRKIQERVTFTWRCSFTNHLMGLSFSFYWKTWLLEPVSGFEQPTYGLHILRQVLIVLSLKDLHPANHGKKRNFRTQYAPKSSLKNIRKSSHKIFRLQKIPSLAGVGIRSRPSTPHIWLPNCPGQKYRFSLLWLFVKFLPLKVVFEPCANRIGSD